MVEGSEYDADPPRKRIRMDATGAVTSQDRNEELPQGKEVVPARAQHRPRAEEPPSSTTAPSSPPPPAERALFSSDPAESDSGLSSAPSSPPTQLPSPVPVARKPAFSFLKRKRDGASEPLSEITPNARKVPRVNRKGMTQMQIDLGGEARKTCRACGMEYIPSVREDAALHKDFCAMNLGGVDVGKVFLRDESAKTVRSERAVRNDRESVVAVDRRGSLAVRNRVRKVLDVVNAELSSAEIGDDELWGGLIVEKVERQVGKRKGDIEGVERQGDRFKAFLYLLDDKCIGFCLVEKISSAFPVIDSGRGTGEVIRMSKSSSISVSTEADVVLLGISRIWTSKSYRSRGLALDLLECARSNFFYGVQVPRTLVAFSQPTESGGRLAERWFEAGNGWHVYKGDQR